MNALATEPYAYGLANQPCGALKLGLNGTPITLRPSGALWLQASGTLVVADLHLEKGSAYAARGQMLPPYDTRDTLRRLRLEVEALTPHVIVLLGDTFHDHAAEDRLADDDAQSICDLARDRDLIWVVGNHDLDGPRALPGRSVPDLNLESLVLRHEPLAGPRPGEVAGHLHPAARVKAARGSVRRRCFVTDGERIILPAFGAYAGGLNVRDPAFSGLFSRQPIAGALGRDRVHAIGWRSLVGD